MNFKRNGLVSLLVALGALGSIAFGAYFYIDDRYAKAGDVKLIERRLDQKIKADRFEKVQERIWKLEDRYEKRPMPESVKEEYRSLKSEKEALDNNIKIMKGGK